MKKNLFAPLVAIMLSFALFSCEKGENELDPVDSSKEYKHLRILISDELSPELSFVKPYDGSLTTFPSRFPKSALYTTESGRFCRNCSS